MNVVYNGAMKRQITISNRVRQGSILSPILFSIYIDGLSVTLYSVEIDLNFNATKSYYVAFTPKLYNLALPSLHINYLSMSDTDSIKYLSRYLVVTTVIMKRC